jgi:hypothetical protein
MANENDFNTNNEKIRIRITFLLCSRFRNTRERFCISWNDIKW